MRILEQLSTQLVEQKERIQSMKEWLEQNDVQIPDFNKSIEQSLELLESHIAESLLMKHAVESAAPENKWSLDTVALAIEATTDAQRTLIENDTFLRAFDHLKTLGPDEIKRMLRFNEQMQR